MNYSQKSFYRKNSLLISISSYVKMQDAYAVEKNEVGTWALIGYKAPQTTSTAGVTTNFSYTEISSKAGTWKAKNNVKLNDCEKGSTWTVNSEMANGSKSADVNHTATTGCGGLTPSFTSLSVSTGSGSTESGSTESGSTESGSTESGSTK